MTTESVSILQPWVGALGLRYQGTLLTVIRGSDSWGKYASEKPLVREMRGLLLVPFDPRELDKLNGFMTRFPDPTADGAFKTFLDNIDPLPVHYVMHLMHAMEIIAYCHPEVLVRNWYRIRYMTLAEKFHLQPETRAALIDRMTEDRIAKGTVEL